jgi:predicted HAD superfamily Cof-like phosphohydrolase
LGIIMASNMSKLGPDGKPIYDERGKVLKGPNYWKPEPMIKRMILARIRQSRSL